MSMVYCKNCQAWRPVNPGDNTGGHCFINPPQATLVPQQGIGGQGIAVVSFRPETRPDDGCSKGLEEGLKTG